jgi:hypothetical protein
MQYQQYPMRVSHCLCSAEKGSHVMHLMKIVNFLNFMRNVV